MPIAEVIAIGTELLLGQIQDTNTAYIAHSLNASGIDIFRATMIGDNENRIAAVINETLERADILITTGGLGPTVDDPTRNAVSLAFGVENLFRPELWEEIQERFRAYGRAPSENNKRQAYLPQGAIVIHNPVGTAPAFFIERKGRLLYSLPGVPSEMKTLLHDEVIPHILNKFKLESAIVTRVLHSIGIGESSVDELVAELETLSNPTLGLAAHPGQVDIRITAKARTRDEALRLIEPMEARVRQLMGSWIFGADETNIVEVVKGLLKKKQVMIKVFADTPNQELSDSICELLGAEVVSIGNSSNHWQTSTSVMHDGFHQALVLNISAQRGLGQGVDLHAELMNNNYNKPLRFGGHGSLYRQWAVNQILGFVREIIIKEKGDE
jgi:competence/damage-inducible protein CinA-like protein